MKFGVDNFYVNTYHITLEQEIDGNGIPICSLIRRKAFDQTPGYTRAFVNAAGNTRALGYEKTGTYGLIFLNVGGRWKQ